MGKVRIVAAQTRPTKANYAANILEVGEILSQCRQNDMCPDVIVFPETALTGYFLEGGVREAARSSEELLSDLADQYARSGYTHPLDVVIGFYERWDGKHYNSCMYATFAPGVRTLVNVHRKFFLPTYGVFDEQRFVSRGRQVNAFPTRFGVKSATLICEDAWHSITSTIAALRGAQILYIVSASPARGFGDSAIGNVAKWRQLLFNIADEHNIFVVQCGLVGFEGGKGFVGSSLVVDPFARVKLEGPVGSEALLYAELDLDDVSVARSGSPLLADLEAGLPDLIRELQALENSYHSAPAGERGEQ